VIVTVGHVVDHLADPFREREGTVHIGQVYVFPEGPSVTVRQETPHGQVNRKARVVVYSPFTEGLDLAILVPETPPFNKLFSFDTPYCPYAGQEVFYSGLPWGLPLAERAVVGNPGLCIPPDSPQEFLVVQGRAWYGSSGSGVFAWTGLGFKLSGVVSRSASGDGHPSPPVVCVGHKDLNLVFNLYRKEYLK
jgi:hypothetical protein